MHLIFFDEAKNDSDYPHYHIGGICIDEGQLSIVETAISDVARDTFGNIDLTAATEFHAAEIYHRKRTFKDWNDFDRRLGVLSRLIDVLSLEPVSLIAIKINCDLLKGEQQADEIAFMFLCERVNDLLKASGERGLLIGDRENDKVSDRFSRILSGYRARGTDFAFGREISNIVDSVHFTHSHLSRFLQLADVYTWILQFRNRHRNSDNIRHKALHAVLGRPEVDLFPNKYKEWPKKS